MFLNFIIGLVGMFLGFILKDVYVDSCLSDWVRSKTMSYSNKVKRTFGYISRK